uniref:Uncharacterized protein n=1 Tax=Rhizophora mucronata TaxID=61149 RepID=A0A2P2NII0_RHIMU
MQQKLNKKPKNKRSHQKIKKNGSNWTKRSIHNLLFAVRYTLAEMHSHVNMWEHPQNETLTS